MTKLEIANAIAAKSGIDKAMVKQIVQLTLEGIIDAIAAEGRLELRDFGVFEVRMMKARKARNPRTGAEVLVPIKSKVCFKIGKVMAEKLNGSNVTTIRVVTQAEAASAVPPQ